jgi:subtilisin family serine protease
VPGSLSIPGDAAAALTVGAVHRADYPAGPAEYYSSLGPNNRAFTGGAAAVKPDLCAPSGITSIAYDDAFTGTSASTPHAAGLAALVKSVYPYLTVNQLKAYLEKYCSDIAPAGKDNTSGAGAARLPALLAVIEGEALKATALLGAGGGAEVRFTGIPGGQYTVMARESLTDGTWESVGTATVAPDGTASFTDPGPLPPTRFYKIVKP